MAIRKLIETTNRTDRWLLIGNYSEQISNHATREEAAAALRNIGATGPAGDELAETPWTRIDIVGPMQTIRGEIQEPLDAEPKPLPTGWMPDYTEPPTN